MEGFLTLPMNLATSHLRYRLLEGSVSLEPLRILAAHALEWRQWRVTFTILGASHAIRLEKGGLLLTELLACAEPTGSGRVLAQVAEFPGTACYAAEGLLCRATLTPFPLEGDDRLQGDFAMERQLAVAYPTLPQGETPLTRLGWQATDRRLRVETVHTYPEERRGIRSLTVFEAREEPS